MVGDIPLIRGKDLNNNFKFIYKTEKTITKLGLDNSSAKMARKGDVVISCRGTVGPLGVIFYPMALATGIYALRANTDYVTNDFLYYLVKHNMPYIKNNSCGTVFDEINRDTFKAIEVNIPSIEFQNMITNTLKPIDLKINLNNAINNNLEQQLQAILKFWVRM